MAKCVPLLLTWFSLIVKVFPVPKRSQLAGSAATEAGGQEGTS